MIQASAPPLPLRIQRSTRTMSLLRCVSLSSSSPGRALQLILLLQPVPRRLQTSHCPVGTVANVCCHGRASTVLPHSTLMPKSGSRRLPRALSLLPLRPNIFCSEGRSDALRDASVVLMILSWVTTN
ncbi:hypothetical protein BDZ89DRAFT_488346 [Hymenopellis radicata]|nr:hypothetical protein BDZ89DRAFT_488346 [Hymenopellis radicata]